MSMARTILAPLLWMTPGASSLVRLLGRDYGLRCVLFHHIEADACAFTRGLEVGVSVERFERLIDFISRHYCPVDLETVIRGVEQDGLPERAVLVTFDDAYRSVATQAAPICERYGVPAVFFLNGALIGNTALSSDNLLCWIANTHGFETLNAAARALVGDAIEPLRSVNQIIRQFLPRLSNEQIEAFLDDVCERLAIDPAALAHDAQLYLNPDDLRRLLDFGFEVANHTLSHARCRALQPEETERQIDGNHDLLLEMTGRHCRAFSIPYGSRRDITADVVSRLESTGEKAVFVVEGLPNRRALDLSYIDRVSMKGKNAAEGFWDIEVLPRIRRIRNELNGLRASTVATNRSDHSA
jgi:peptidoglycan/xylan/chitin deacetylase (PgdA/CDA1 family)